MTTVQLRGYVSGFSPNEEPFRSEIILRLVT